MLQILLLLWVDNSLVMQKIWLEWVFILHKSLWVINKQLKKPSKFLAKLKVLKLKILEIQNKFRKLLDQLLVPKSQIIVISLLNSSQKLVLIVYQILLENLMLIMCVLYKFLARELVIQHISVVWSSREMFKAVSKGWLNLELLLIVAHSIPNILILRVLYWFPMLINWLITAKENKI